MGEWKSRRVQLLAGRFLRSIASQSPLTYPPTAGPRQLSELAQLKAFPTGPFRHAIALNSLGAWGGTQQNLVVDRDAFAISLLYLASRMALPHLRDRDVT